VLGLCGKELIGSTIAPHMHASLVVDAVSAAHRAGLVTWNAIMHTDRGGQSHASACRNTLKRLEIRQSTSRIGSCLDGAAAESFFATVKTEIGMTSWPDRASAHRDVEHWITHYYHRRPHSALNYRTRRKPESPGSSACPPPHEPKWCPEPCPVRYATPARLYTHAEQPGGGSRQVQGSRLCGGEGLPVGSAR
jgi:transposase InsO family protein